MKKATITVLVLCAMFITQIIIAQGSSSPIDPSKINAVTVMAPTFKMKSSPLTIFVKDDPAMSAQLEKIIKPLVEEQFKNSGHSLAPLNLSSAALSQDVDMQTNYRKLLANYDEYRNKISKGFPATILTGRGIVFVNGIDEKKWKANGPFSLGEVVGPFCEMAKSDALVFITGDGQFIAGANDNRGVLNISVVGKEGIVLDEISLGINFPLYSTKDADFANAIRSALEKKFKKR